MQEIPTYPEPDLLFTFMKLFEPVRNKFAFAPIKDSEKPAHPRSLIRVFDRRFMDSEGSFVFSDGM